MKSVFMLLVCALLSCGAYGQLAGANPVGSNPTFMSHGVGSQWIYKHGSRLDTVTLVRVYDEKILLSNGETEVRTICVTDNGMAWCDTKDGLLFGHYNKHVSPISLSTLVGGKLQTIKTSDGKSRQVIALVTREGGNEYADYYEPNVGLVQETRNGSITFELVSFSAK